MSKKNDEINIRNEEVQEILSEMPHWMILWGNSIIFCTIILFFYISWIIKYPDTITVSALITTKIPPQKVYSQTYGKLESILVSDHDYVERNQVLAIIQNTGDFKDIYLLKNIIDTIAFQNHKSLFPIEVLPVLNLGEIESAYASFQSNYMEYYLNNELRPYSIEAYDSKNTIVELRNRLKILQHQQNLNKLEIEFKKKEFKRYESLFEKGVISAQEFEKIKLEYFQTKRTYENFEISISQIKVAISNANRVSKEIEIKKKKESIISLQMVITSFNKLKESIKNWENKYVLKSNLNGYISFLNIWNQNQIVNKGDLVFTITPDSNSRFIAKLKAPIRNSGKIKIGQTVNINLENYPESEYGIIRGIVTSISLMPDDNGFYNVNAILNKELETSYGKKIAYNQEMYGSAGIVTEDLRLIDRFFYQFRELFNH